MIHRYFAGALGLLILGLALHALVRRGRDGQPLKLPLLLLARGAALPGGDPRTGGAGPAPGDRPDHPRRLGQQQLCGGGLHRPAHLP
ncbi:hypothetical protein RLJV_23790 [Pseudomonas aeruginosa]|nr:hypothetical protein RLJV_23790 [Pseudomonas aeruginosa]